MSTFLYVLEVLYLLAAVGGYAYTKFLHNRISSGPYPLHFAKSSVVIAGLISVVCAIEHKWFSSGLFLLLILSGIFDLRTLKRLNKIKESAQS